MPNDKFLLIKAWSYILWLDVEHTLSQLLVAELTGRTPVVYWPTHCLHNGFVHTNGFELYFEPVSNYTIFDAARPEYTFYPPVWDSDNLLMDDPNRDTWVYRNIGEILSCKANVLVGDVYVDIYNLIPFIGKESPEYGMSVNQIYGYLFKKYLRLKQDIEVEIQGFYNSWLRENHPVLAVHVCGAEKDQVYDPDGDNRQSYRYRSKSYSRSRKQPMRKKIAIPRFGIRRRKVEPNKPYHDEIKKFIDKYDVKKIFLLTNSEEILKEYRKKYGSMVVATQCKRLSEETNTQHLDSFIVKRRSGVEILKDTYLAAKCDFFIGSDFSSLSHAVTRIKEWPAENVKLLYWEYRKKKFPINAEVLVPRERFGFFRKLADFMKKRFKRQA
ncbi:MAG TPA: O-fucosyltransferase family protein [Caproiciproducens sp.]|nr:O-fucosyltransferase family protein [Caproiciproducens sp.]